MAYELRDHTADVAVVGTGDSLEAVFAAVADGLAGASCDDVPPSSGERFSVSVRAEGLEALLFDYLDELIFQRDIRSVMPVDNRVKSIESSEDGNEGLPEKSGDWSLEASARGVDLADIDAREVKAVTYSEMRLEETDEGWEAYVVFDV